MRVIASHDVTDRRRAFAIGLGAGLTILPQRIKYAPMHRFQAVAQVRNCTADDHGHGIVEVARLHLRFDRDRRTARFGAVFFFVLRGFWRIAHVWGLLVGLPYIVKGLITETNCRAQWRQRGLRWQPKACAANTLFSLKSNESLGSIVRHSENEVQKCRIQRPN